MLRHFCILCAAVCSLWAAIIMFFVIACSSGSKSGEKNEQNDGSIRLFLGKLEVPLFDSISIHVSAIDMASIHESVNSIQDNIKIDGISIGENRKFEVKIYADSGKLVQKGEAVADISANQTTTIPITLTSLSGFLRIEIPLGLTNNTEVSSGKLFLDSFEFQMQFENGKGVFNTGALPLNQVFTLKIELKNKNGEILFTGEKQITLSSILQTETIQLQSTKGSVIIELEAGSSGPVQILAVLPISISREPENYGDLFFTEIFADPKTNGTDFEYLEIYNATLDTLKLSSCRIAQSRSNATEGKNRLNMPENLILPPMEYLFFGRDSVESTDFSYKSFELTNSGQSLGFFCGNLVIDSLRYSKDADNPFPLAQGKAMQLPLSNFENRAIGDFWCFGFSPKKDAICATP